MVTEAAMRGEVNSSLVSVDSTTARAHHDAAGTHLGEDVIAALEEAATEEEKTRPKGAVLKDGADRTPKWILNGKSGGISGAGKNSG
ncbi:hypothetical protein [Streptomyces sp. NPDC001068]|uniref:hypothetical protein n=1 Tax=Streptomyces sp. NPDC001068 TaxID=3364544 RepID=UPI00368CCAFA